jgi:hypothetical protein
MSRKSDRRTAKQEDTGRVRNRRFSDFVEAAKISGSSLPLTHITDAYRFREIVGTSKLVPKYCHVFDAPLLYFFYGRPAYRVNQEAQSSAIEAYAPICFLVDPVFELELTALYPFDTGAFHKRLLAGAFHNEMKKEDFALEPNLDSPRKLIQLFFGSVDRYYSAKPRPSVKIDPFDFEASSYHGLINDKLQNVYDDRISAIELHSKANFTLKGSTMAVVLPSNFLDRSAAAGGVKAFLKEIEADALPYDYVPRMRTDNYTSQIYSIVKSYYLKKGLLRG